MPLPDPRKLTAQRIARTEAYADKIQRMFSETVNELLSLPLSKADVGQGQMYSFDAETARTRRKAEQLLRRLHAASVLAIQKGIELEWGQANAAADAILKSQFSKKALSSPHMKGWNARNLDAMRQFIDRSDTGMSLSQRVWQSCRQLRDEMEVALTISIGEGEDAGTISRRVRRYLNDPDLMFRRFRYKDETGQWQTKWKKRINDPDRPGRYRFIDYDKDSYKDQWTGKGYYKSAAQNAMRVARTETNIAYRRADHERWQGLDFVLGQRVVLSNSHPMPDICDRLSAPNKREYAPDDKRGLYPKDFVFDGWHPQCFCFVIPVMVDPEEMERMDEAFARGEDYTPRGEQVTEYPEEFKDWVRDNATKIKAAQHRGTEPYFIRNNAEAVEGIINPKENRPKGQTLYTDDYCARMKDRFSVWSRNNRIPQRMDGGQIKDCFALSEWDKLDILKLDDDIRAVFDNFGINDMSTKIWINPDKSVEIKWSSSDGEIELIRTFSIDDKGYKKVHHELFTLPKELQGKGISKAVFRGLYEQYQAAGVKYMDVFANIDAGGYAWAKYGFCTENRSEAISAIKLSALTGEQEDEIISIIDEHFGKSNAPFPMNKIAILPYGKEALLGQCWDGILDLTDPVQRKYFENYIGFNNRGS